MAGDLSHRRIWLLVRPDRVVDGVAGRGGDVVIAGVTLVRAIRLGSLGASLSATTSPSGTYCTAGYVDSCSVNALRVSATTSPLTRTVTCLPVGSTVMGWASVGSSTGLVDILNLLTPVVT
jgi:hypothetical protein